MTLTYATMGEGCRHRRVTVTLAMRFHDPACTYRRILRVMMFRAEEWGSGERFRRFPSADLPGRCGPWFLGVGVWFVSGRTPAFVRTRRSQSTFTGMAPASRFGAGRPGSRVRFPGRIRVFKDVLYASGVIRRVAGAL